MRTEVYHEGVTKNPPPTPYDLAFELLRKLETRIAVVGASNNPEKYGNIITRDLQKRGYVVYPVNLNETVIEGLPVYRTLADLPEPVDIVDVVTPPEVTRVILKEAAAAGLPLVWLQDGSFDERFWPKRRPPPSGPSTMLASWWPRGRHGRNSHEHARAGGLEPPDTPDVVGRIRT